MGHITATMNTTTMMSIDQRTLGRIPGIQKKSFQGKTLRGWYRIESELLFARLFGRMVNLCGALPT